MISYEGKRLWALDMHLEIIIFYVIGLLELKHHGRCLSSEEKAWLNSNLDQLKFYFNGFTSGAIDFNFDQIMCSEVRKGILIEVFYETRFFFNSLGAYLNKIS